MTFRCHCVDQTLLNSDTFELKVQKCLVNKAVRNNLLLMINNIYEVMQIIFLKWC